MKWMITECREKKHRRTLMPEKLSHELLEAFHNQGPVIKRKHDMHKMAEANRALAHYRCFSIGSEYKEERSPRKCSLPS